DRHGAQLFNRDLEVIRFDAVIYGGMSGAPVLRNGRVVGILSGSFDEGGSICWAIPSTALGTYSTRRGLSVREVEWPRFDLMTDSWRSLATNSARSLAETRLRRLEHVERNLEEIIESMSVEANQAASALGEYKDWLDRSVRELRARDPAIM